MQIARALRGAADMQIANFKADMLTMQSQNVPMDATNPLAMRLMSQLEVLHQWACMFTRLIERFESRNYDHFDVMIRSEDLSSVLLNLLALTAN